jgi:alkylated DNA repair dioxygenase AlkB
MVRTHALQSPLREVAAEFTLPAAFQPHRVPGATDVVLVPAFLPPTEADTALATLGALRTWRQESIRLFGRVQAVPRRIDWCGDRGRCYRYSHVDHACDGWREPYGALRARVARALGWHFDFVLANRYRDGADAMGWHSDAEPILGARPVIASLSFGATRRFRLRRMADGHCVDIDLDHGSLLVMFGESQHAWQHALPRTKRPVGDRVSLTYRWLRGVPSDA